MPVANNKKPRVAKAKVIKSKEAAAESKAATPNPNDPFIGKKIGNCEVTEKINEGGTAYIYKAFNTSFKMFRVLKILKPTLMDEQDFHILFIQEAQLTARLDHPHILRVFDTGVVDGHFYIEMEYIEGETLRTLISKRGKLSEREMLHITSQITRALKYAHSAKIKTPSGKIINGILHRDIKPENIMITADNTVKLMDFGAAKPLDLSSSTNQGMIVGTFHYMSPEQIDGMPMDARSDFFSLGIVMYELFTGQKPFVSDKLPSLIAKIQASKYKSLKKVRPSISPMTEELIDKLLYKKSGFRPKKAEEIDEAIQISLQVQTAWAAGNRAKVPFSIRQFYPTLALIISILALIISLTSRGSKPANSEKEIASKEVSESLSSMLERGKKAERKGLWKEAVSIYELVPAVNNGGVANEYLEAQIRIAAISFSQFNQFTKARAILEKLRMKYSDPAIDAYLGQIYYRQALYYEACERLKAAVNSQKGSVIPQTNEFKKTLLYYFANSLDGQYIYVEKTDPLLGEAIKAWENFIEFAGCIVNTKDKKCKYARERVGKLKKEQKNKKKNNS